MREELIEYFGSQHDLAEAIGVSTSAVSQWLSSGSIPAQRLIDIELVSEGFFKAKDLYLTQTNDYFTTGRNKHPMPTDEEVEEAIAKHSRREGASHQHPDCVRVAFAFLDAQKKTKRPCRCGAPLKHLIEGWAGRYVSTSDVDIAAILHPEIHGDYPNFNISQKIIYPCHQRLNGLVTPFTESYSPQMSFYVRSECPGQKRSRTDRSAPKEFMRGESE